MDTKYHYLIVFLLLTIILPVLVMVTHQEGYDKGYSACETEGDRHRPLTLNE